MHCELARQAERGVVFLFAGALALTVAGTAMAQQPRSTGARPLLHAAQAHAATNDAPERTTATYDDWVVQCETRAGPPPTKTCDMAQVTQIQGRNLPFSRVVLPRPVRGEPVKLVVQVPVNASFAAKVRIHAGTGDAGLAVPFARCVPGGCFADFEVGEEELKKFRTDAKVGKLTFADAGGHDVSVPLSFKGFAHAFDALSRE